MFHNEVEAVGSIAQNKIRLYKDNKSDYFLLSMLAGIYVGFGILLIFSIGGLLSASEFAGTKIVMGISFGIALSLVIMCGAELFTGNNFVMTLGLYQKKVSCKDVLTSWAFCWIGNLAGSVLLGVLFHFSGLNTGSVAEFIAQTTAIKMTLPAEVLLIRGLLCNVLVCLAIWCSIKLNSEAGKLLMVFWCLFAFITTGFEHSVANMTLMTIGLLNPMGQAISLGGYFYNLIFVTIGNMIGGIILVGLPYAKVGRKTA